MPDASASTRERNLDPFNQDELAALAAFAKFWPEALKRAEQIGLKKTGFDMATATELARNVWLGGFYQGASYGAERLKQAVLAARGKDV